MIKRLLPWLVLLLAIAVFMILRMTRPEPVQAEAQERVGEARSDDAQRDDARNLLVRRAGDR